MLKADVGFTRFSRQTFGGLQCETRGKLLQNPNLAAIIRPASARWEKFSFRSIYGKFTSIFMQRIQILWIQSS